MILLYIINDVFRRWREAPHYTCFVKDRRLFPHALGARADKKWNEHANTRSLITSFSAKISEFCEVRIAPIYSKRDTAPRPCFWNTANPLKSSAEGRRVVLRGTADMEP